MRVEPRPEVDEVVTTSPVRTALIAAAVIVLGYVAGFATVVVIVALILMLFLHELGHYLTAKAAGMKVTEFFIGFGPRIWSFHRGETEYGFKVIPAGAYVRIIGMSNLEEVDPAEEERTYRAKPYWRRMSVALAGSAMHFLIAFLLVFVIFSGFGLADYDSDRWKIGVVSGPALEAGLDIGDRIVTIDGEHFESFDALSEHLRANPGEVASVVVSRDGAERTFEVTLARRNPSTGEKVGFLGIRPEYDRVRVDPLSGAGRSVKEVGTTIWGSIRGLGHVFSPDGLSGYVDTLSNAGEEGDEPEVGPGAEDRFLSPVGAVRFASQALASSIVDVLGFLFAINVFVGVFNLVPLLPLDGGHVVIATYEKIRSMLSGRRYQADVAKLLPLTYAVFVILVVIGVSALWIDIVDPVDNPFE